jgi:uncharacterized protein (TIGR03435 family)
VGAAAHAQAQAEPSTLPAFEVASVKLTPRANLGFTNVSPWGTGRFTATNAGLYLLVEIAFGTTPERIVGIDKLGDEHYDVNAKGEGDLKLTYDEVKPRLQRLLAERFKLLTHREMKETDGFVLEVAKGGSKLKPSKGETTAGALYPGAMNLPSMSMEGLAAALANPLGRPVIDQTGISGTYDIQLRFVRDATDDSGQPALPTALQEQLGLRLESRKVPVETLVIDSVDKIPADN